VRFRRPTTTVAILAHLSGVPSHAIERCSRRALSSASHAVRGFGFRGVAPKHRDAAGPAHGYQEHVRADGAG
jgi:hypothetical protein